LDKAEEFMRKSVAVNPNNVPIWINLANLLSEQKDINKKKEALQIYKKYLKETPKAYKLDSLIIVMEKEIRGG
jgi:predicted Zn-dependent protease